MLTMVFEIASIGGLQPIPWELRIAFSQPSHAPVKHEQELHGS
jgi:hypothetical protein